MTNKNKQEDVVMPIIMICIIMPLTVISMVATPDTTALIFVFVL